MRLPIALLLLSLLAGCAGTPPPTAPEPVPAPAEPPQRETRIHPDPVNPQLSSIMTGDDELARAFLESYYRQALYDNRHAEILARDYGYLGSHWSPKRDRLMMLFRNERGDSGFVAWSLSGHATATSLRLEDSKLGRHFALVLRPARLCFAIDAGRPPTWLGGRWAYDPQRPGSFECNGLTNRSAFRAGTRLPALLGAYYSEGDTVLLYDSRQQRDEAAGILARLFPALSFSPR